MGSTIVLPNADKEDVDSKTSDETESRTSFTSDITVLLDTVRTLSK
jgi:hypothetical protein